MENALPEYKLISQIGEGTFGVVLKARQKRPPHKLVAIKRLLNLDLSQGFHITSVREIVALKTLSHPHLLQLVDIVPDPETSSFFLVLPFMAADLAGIILDPRIVILVPETKNLTLQLLDAVAYLHSQKFIHRDIKTANILLLSDNLLKLGDFGLTRRYAGQPPKKNAPGGGASPMTTLVVARWYRAPEILLGDKYYTTAVDMWAVGCVFAEFYARKPILPGSSDLDQLNEIFKLVGLPSKGKLAIFDKLHEDSLLEQPTDVDFLRLKLRLAGNIARRFDKMDSSALDLLMGLLTLSPARRLTATGARDHPWFKQEPVACTRKELQKFGLRHEIDIKMERLARQRAQQQQQQQQQHQQSQHQQSQQQLQQSKQSQPFKQIPLKPQQQQKLQVPQQFASQSSTSSPSILDLLGKNELFQPSFGGRSRSGSTASEGRRREKVYRRPLATENRSVENLVLKNTSSGRLLSPHVTRIRQQEISRPQTENRKPHERNRSQASGYLGFDPPRRGSSVSVEDDTASFHSALLHKTGLSDVIILDEEESPDGADGGVGPTEGLGLRQMGVSKSLGGARTMALNGVHIRIDDLDIDNERERKERSGHGFERYANTQYQTSRTPLQVQVVPLGEPIMQKESKNLQKSGSVGNLASLLKANMREVEKPAPSSERRLRNSHSNGSLNRILDSRYMFKKKEGSHPYKNFMKEEKVSHPYKMFSGK